MRNLTMHTQSHGNGDARLMANMKQIAELAGVSLGTVSNVLSGSAAVREPLRRKVMEAVEATGYQPSQLGRALRRDKINMIAMIIPDIMNPFFPAVVRGAQDVAFENDFRFILCNTDNNQDTEIAHLNALRTYLPSGLIVIPSSLSRLTSQAHPYVKSGTAVVCVDRLPRDWRGDSVTADNARGSYDATVYALSLGHRRLAMIAGPRHFTNVRHRIEGFRRAMAEKKLPTSPEYVQESSFDHPSGYAKAMLLLKLKPRPTIIFAGNDLIAFGVLRAIHELGLRCPEQISLMGFDNLALAETMSPPLTSVSQPGYQMGSSAASLIIDRVRGKTGRARHVVLETTLRIRESVAAPRSGRSSEART